MNGRDGSFFPFLTPAEIYRQLTEGDGPQSLFHEQQVTSDERAAEEERASLVRSLASMIESGWQGKASGGAYGAAMPLAERMLENADKLDRSQDLLARQIDSFNTASNSVRPVGDPPELSLDEKFPFDVDHEKAVKEYQDAAQNNIVVFRAYDGASHYNETNIPQEYHTVDRSGGDVSVAGPADTIAVGEPGPGMGGPRGGGPGDVAGPGNSGYFGDGPHVSGPVVGGYPAGSGSPVGPGGSQTSPTEFRPSPTGSSPVSSYPSAGQSSPVSGGFGGVPFGGYSGGGPVGGFGPRGGGPGAGGGHGGGPGAGGRGPGLGAGVGALAAEEAARRGAQAAGTRAGGIGPMGAPVGTGRSKDDEDTEHQRKVLLETDAEETFGSDVLTAPQVIGDDEYED